MKCWVEKTDLLQCSLCSWIVILEYIKKDKLST